MTIINSIGVLLQALDNEAALQAYWDLELLQGFYFLPKKASRDLRCARLAAGGLRRERLGL